MEAGIIGSLNEEIILGPLSGWPAWGRQVFVGSLQRRMAGSAVSVALPLAKLGIKTGVLGVVGDDENGVLIRQRLSRAGVDTRGISRIKGKQTGLCVSVFRSDAERAYISALSALEDFKPGHLKRKEAYLGRAKIVLLTGCFVIPGVSLSQIYRFFQKCRRRGQIVCLDTGWDPQGWPIKTLTEVRKVLSEVDVFLPNEDEARVISGRKNLDGAVRELWSLGPGRVYVKTSFRGCIGGGAGKIIRQKAFPAAKGKLLMPGSSTVSYTVSRIGRR